GIRRSLFFSVMAASGRGSGGRLFHSAVRVASESAAVARMHGLVLAKRPAAELSTPVVVEGLLELRTRVHHEWPVLRDRLGDRPALEHEYLDRTVERRHAHGLVARNIDCGWLRDDASRDVDLLPGEEIESAADGSIARRRNRPGGIRLELDQPDRDVGVRARGPRIGR